MEKVKDIKIDLEKVNIEDIKKLKKIILNKQLLKAINKQVKELGWNNK